MQISCDESVYCDVIVIGGGTAGCFAAASAAQAGAKVILVEKNGMLGGTMTTAGVCFPGLFFAWGRQIIAGPCWQLIEEAARLGKATIPEVRYSPERHWEQQISINRFTWAYLLDELCEKHGVTIWAHCMPAAVDEQEDGVTVLIATKSGLRCVKAKVLIDATGDANAVQMAGYPCLRSETLQPATLTAELSGYDAEKLNYDAIKEQLTHTTLPEWISAEKVCDCLKWRSMNIHHRCPSDADTSSGRTALEQNARKTVFRLIKAINSIPGLENVTVTNICTECGVRESVRIAGEHIITTEEYMNGTLFDDAVCYAFYPIDLHIPDGIKMIYPEEGIVPAVPYRALIPKDSRHILAAGRIVSSETDANSALRVEAACMAEGQAAGCAAAIAARTNSRCLSVGWPTLRAELMKQGAIVPSRNS